MVPDSTPRWKVAHRREGCSQKTIVTELHSLKQLGVVAWAILQPLRGHLELVQDWNFHLVVRSCPELSQAGLEGEIFPGPVA